MTNDTHDTEPQSIVRTDTHGYWEDLTDYEEQIMSVFATENIVTELIAAVPDKSDKVVADLGCGTGNALPFLTEFRQVYAVDYSENMLDFAKGKAGPNVEFIQSTLEEISLPEPADLTLAISCIMPENPVHFYSIMDNVLANTADGGELVMVFPSFESRTFSFHVTVEHLADKGMSPEEIEGVLEKDIVAYQYNPLGYMLTDGGLMQKAWLEHELEYRLRRYDLKGLTFHKMKLDWTKQVKRPEMADYPRPWLWCVHAKK